MNNSFCIRNSSYSLLLSFLTIVLLITSCQKEESLDSPISSKKTQQPITFCNYDTENDSYELLTVLPKELARLLGKGDVILDDNDGDGFYPTNGCGYGPMGDCDDNNSSINPDAPEICKNDVDENCDGLIGSDDPSCEQGCQAVCDDNVEIAIVTADIICPPFSTYSIGWEITVINNGELEADKWSVVQAWLSQDEQLGGDSPAGGRIINTYLETCEETSFFFGATAGDPTLFNFLLLQLRPTTDQTDCDMSNNLVAIPIPQDYPDSHCGG